MDNRSEMLQLCRLCLVKDDVNIPIFEEQGDIRQIFLKISSCLPVKVSREDKLPQKICDGCSYKLDMLYEFWNTTANAEKQLLSWLGEAGMNSKMADGTMSAVAQQIKPVETFVKQEAIDPSDIHTEENDDDKSYMFQDKFTADEAGPSATVTPNAEEEEEEEPPPKRARRTAAVKAQIAMDPESDDDDDDSGEPMTKIEDESEDSEGDDHESSFVDVPSTSADDQPGPSGVGKDGVEAPVVKLEAESESFELKIEVFDDDNLKMIKPERKEEIKIVKQDEKITKDKKVKSRKISNKMVHPPPMLLDEPIQCAVCNASFTNNVDFSLHSLSHSEDGKYTCHLCNHRIVSRYHIETHVRAHEGSTSYKCEICGKTFTAATYAIEHKNFHTGEKPFQCEICGKHFIFSKQLNNHRRTSHYEILTGKPLAKFNCTKCSKQYVSASALRIHKIRKHNHNNIDLSALCDVCGKTFSNRGQLNLHCRTHTGYKPHACHICPKSFSKKPQLIDHIRVHTGEKPYVCKLCGKGFSQRAPLRIHGRTHKRKEQSEH